MSVFEIIGFFYTVLATTVFTVYLFGILLVGFKEVRQKYERGKREEGKDVAEGSLLRDALRTGR